MSDEQKPQLGTESTNVQELIKKGNEIYETLKNGLEPAQNSKWVVIEVQSGKYFVGDTRTDAVAEARKVFPTQVMFARRIGVAEKTLRHIPHPSHKYARVL